MRYLFLIILGLVLLSGHGPVLALSWAPPAPYMRTSENGKYLFVMVSGQMAYQDSEAIVKRFKVSGMYKNDGSDELLWEYTGHLDSDAIPLNDGQHVIWVREGYFVQTTNNIQVAIYRKQELLNEFSVQDINAFLFQASRSTVIYPGQAKEREWKDRTVLKLHVIDRGYLYFDVMEAELLRSDLTGEIGRYPTMDDLRPGLLEEEGYLYPILFTGLVLTIFLGFGLAFVFVLRGKLKQKSQRVQRSLQKGG